MRVSHRPDATPGEKVLASEAALSLLARSIDFGHGRLAVVRLSVAVSAGAKVPREHWMYCAKVAQGSQDRRLQEIYLAAAQDASEAACV